MWRANLKSKRSFEILMQKVDKGQIGIVTFNRRPTAAGPFFAIPVGGFLSILFPSYTFPYIKWCTGITNNRAATI